MCEHVLRLAVECGSRLYQKRVAEECSDQSLLPPQSMAEKKNAGEHRHTDTQDGW